MKVKGKQNSSTFKRNNFIAFILSTNIGLWSCKPTIFLL
ncbi:unnamed protein product [Schistosoma mattheei]|uniref:Uncharacterized protein n=1 Tax=Schistosoma mattheei TaxID=31246 RepID=A0A183Q0Y1_9TREM|nr:unnamed protein product [Schistosoma mattheei]